MSFRSLAMSLMALAACGSWACGHASADEWIANVGADGTLICRVTRINPSTGATTAVSPVKASLVDWSGHVVASGTADALGEIRLSDVLPGTYGLIAKGEDAYLAVGLSVVPGTGGPKLAPLPSSVPTADLQPIQEFLSDWASQREFQVGGRRSGRTFPVGAGDHERADIVLDQFGTMQGNVIALRPQGSRATVTGICNILLVQYGRVAHRVRSDISGRFEVRGVRPGVYSLVATGQTGFSVQSIRVVSAGEANVNPLGKIPGNGDGMFPVAHINAGAQALIGAAALYSQTNSVDVVLVPGASYPVWANEDEQDPSQSESQDPQIVNLPLPPGTILPGGPALPGGGFPPGGVTPGGGFTGGGGGGFGGFGGAGAALGAGGLAAGIAALADDDDDGVLGDVIIVSPAIP